jgi:LuxR family maltose regulon positive regulatory protein
MKASPRRGGVAAPAPSNDRIAIVEPLPLSRAKLVPPRLPGHVVAVDRQRQWIDQLLLHDVTLIVAPGDFGKSTLCASLYGHLRELGHRCGWVSLDSDLSSAAAGDYVVAAIAEMVDGAPYDPGDRASPGATAVRLANAIQALAEPVILFLDDADRIRDDWCGELLDQLMQQRCADLHLVLTCSGRVPAFARRVEQRAGALKLDVDDLRLSDLEVAELFATSGMFVDDAQVADLNAVMVGWTGGLKIVAGTLRQMTPEAIGGDWEERCCGALGPSFDLALDTLPAAQRSFLLRCAVVRDLAPALCTALTGVPDATAMLRDLSESGLLVQRLRGVLDRYRIHPAFRSFLLRRMTAIEPALLPDLYRRASAWHGAQGMTGEAIQLALAGQDSETAAGLLAGQAMAMIAHAGPLDVGEALGQLPSAAIAARPALQRALAWTTALRADLGETGITHPPAPEADEAAIAAARAFMQKDRFDIGLEQATAYLADHSEDRDFAARMMRGFAALAEMQQGRHRHAYELLRPIVARTRGKDGDLPEAIGQYVIAAAHRAQGRPADAERTLRDAAARMERTESRKSAPAALLSVGLARAFYERNDVASAACMIEGRIPMLEQVGVADALIQAYVVAIRVAASLGRIDEAAALIDRAELVAYDRRWLPMQAMCAVERWRLHLPAVVELDRIVPAAIEDAVVERPLSAEARAFAILSEARAYDAIAQDDRPRLTLVADRLLRLAETAKDVGLQVRGTLFNILPQLSGRCGRMVEIDTAKFLNQAASLGYIRTMVDILDVTGVRTSQDFCSSDYSAGSFLALLRLAQPSPGESRTGAHEPGTSTAFSFLSPREIEIVNALHAGETNKVIARQLGLTPETIKWHLKNLMKKLRANSRGEVVCNAAALGLSLSVPGAVG